METFLMPENAKKKYCEKCDFTCSKESNWKKHLTTAKHMKEINGNVGNEQTAVLYECDICNKEFKTKSGLWKHKKKCNYKSEKDINIESETSELMIENKEMTYSGESTDSSESTDFKSMFLEVMKKNFMTALDKS